MSRPLDRQTSEPDAPPRQQRCLLLADSTGCGPALIAGLRRVRGAAGGLFVHVVLPYRQPIGAGLLIGDPLAGWVAIDSLAAHECEEATRQAAGRQLNELRWLLWEMEVPSSGEVLAADGVTGLLRRSAGDYDVVLVVRHRFVLARWREARWVRRARRQSVPALELVREPARRSAWCADPSAGGLNGGTPR
jgi:hypothetical protein